MPLLGFGVYQNYDAKPGVLEAFKAGYRFAVGGLILVPHYLTRYLTTDTSTLPRCTEMRQPSARLLRSLG
jgi:hypothetical protein